MRTILLTALCTITIGTQAKVANDTIDKYIIDKQPVEHFDGSQLEGKRISKYMIAYKQGKGVVERHHVIYTGDEARKAFTIEGDADGPIVVSKMLGPLIIVDGKESSNEEMALIKSEDVASVYVFEPGSEVAKSYGEKGSKGVIMVTTKATSVTKVVEPLIIVDGKETSQEDFAKINSAEIANITVLKPDPAVKIWGNKGCNGVIQVTTKANTSAGAAQFDIDKHLIIVDGKETSLEEFNKMKPKSEAEYVDKFASMEIFKPGSKEAKSYGEKGHNGVIIVKTKGGKESK